MSSTSRNRAYHPIPPNPADTTIAVSSSTQPSSVININGNPIEAAFEAQIKIQKRSEEFEAELGDRINQLFPRCPPSAVSSQSKGSKEKKSSNTGTGKKKVGQGKKKSNTAKVTKTKEAVQHTDVKSSLSNVEIVDNIVDLTGNGSNCEEVNRQNYMHHQQMISNNRDSLKTMLKPTTSPADANTFAPNDNVLKNSVNKNSQRSTLVNKPNIATEVPRYSQQSEFELRQDIHSYPTATINPSYNNSYVNDNAITHTNDNKTSHHQIINQENLEFVESSTNITSSLEENNTGNYSIINQYQSADSSAASSSNRSLQGTYSSMSGGTGSSIGHLDSVSENSNSFPPSAGPTATPSSVTSYSYSSSAMMMSPGSSTASSSEHSASVGNSGLRGTGASSANAKFSSPSIHASSTQAFQGENNVIKDHQQDQIITAVNAGRIRKNLSEYSVSGVDNRIPAASSFGNTNQNIPDGQLLKDTKIEIAGMGTNFFFLNF